MKTWKVVGSSRRAKRHNEAARVLYLRRGIWRHHVLFQAHDSANHHTAGFSENDPDLGCLLFSFWNDIALPARPLSLG